MKAIFIIFFNLCIFLVFPICNTLKAQVTLSDYNLKGPVKTCRSSLYEAVKDSGKFIKGKIAGREMVMFQNVRNGNVDSANYKADFSKTGKLMMKTFYFSNGKIFYKEIYEYDSLERITKIKDLHKHTEFVYDKNDNLSEEFNYHFDSKYKYTWYKDGTIRTKEETFGVGSKKPVSTVEKYDKTGKLIDKYTLDKNGIRDTNTIYTIDKKGNITEDYKAYPIINSYIKMSYYYNKKGKKTKRIVSVKNEEPYTKEYFIYDKKGNLTEERNYKSPSVLIYKKKFKYDASGKKLEEIFYDSKEKVAKRQILTYDKNGVLIKESRYDKYKEFDKSEDYDYFYDSRMNLSKEIIYVNGKAKYIIEYDITYY